MFGAIQPGPCSGCRESPEPEQRSCLCSRRGRLFTGSRSCLHQPLAPMAATDTQTGSPAPAAPPWAPGASGALLGRRGSRAQGSGLRAGTQGSELRLSHSLILLHTPRHDLAQLSSFPCLPPALKSGGPPPALRDVPASPRDTLGNKGCSHWAWWGLCPSPSSMQVEEDKDGQTEVWTDPQQCVISIIPFPDP